LTTVYSKKLKTTTKKQQQENALKFSLIVAQEFGQS
jgi:hypothetical protein